MLSSKLERNLPAVEGRGADSSRCHEKTGSKAQHLLQAGKYIWGGRSMKKIILILISCCFLILLGVGGWQLYQYWNESRQGNEMYTGLEDYIILPEDLPERVPNEDEPLNAQEASPNCPRLILQRCVRSTRILWDGFIVRILPSIIQLSRGTTTLIT